MKILVIALFLVIAISACSPSLESIQNAVAGTLTVLPAQSTETSLPTQTPLPTKTAYPTITRWPTNTPRPTSTPKPTNTIGPSRTPFPTITPLPPDALTATAQYKLDLILYGDHNPGVYLVNVDIGAGIWRNSSSSDSCYWKRSDKYGEIIDNYFGFGGGTIYIAPTDFSVELDKDCGVWTYFSPP